MNKANENIEIKIPIFIPVIIIVLMFILISKIYALNTNNQVEAVEPVQDVTEEQGVVEPEEIPQENAQRHQAKDIIESTVEENSEETAEQTQEHVETEQPKTVTYIASNGKNYDVIARLNIPSLGIEYPILSTTSEALLKVALNKYWGANPNEVGNMVVIGHNYKNSKFFGKLPNIEIGAIVKITDLTGKTLDYTVYDTYVIVPEDNSCTSQLTNGQTEITLITCYYENGMAHATKRFVVKARAY